VQPFAPIQQNKWMTQNKTENEEQICRMWLQEKLDKLEQNVGVEMSCQEVLIPAMFYIKKAQRTINFQAANTLEIIDITIQESHRRQGHFKSLLTMFKEYCSLHKLALVFDVVLNDFLVEALKRQGFTEIQTHPVVTMYYREDTSRYLFNPESNDQH
jgi:hypothetical protein